MVIHKEAAVIKAESEVEIKKLAKKKELYDNLDKVKKEKAQKNLNWEIVKKELEEKRIIKKVQNEAIIKEFFEKLKETNKKKKKDNDDLIFNTDEQSNDSDDSDFTPSVENKRNNIKRKRF